MDVELLGTPKSKGTGSIKIFKIEKLFYYKYYLVF